MRSLVASLGCVAVLWLAAPARLAAAETDLARLSGAAPLTLEGDLASNLVAGVDRFLLRQTESSLGKRTARWHRDFTSPDRYSASLATNRQQLARILGLRDPRKSPPELRILQRLGEPLSVAREERCELFTVEWDAFGDVHGEGLLLTPRAQAPLAEVVVLPDADQTPEQLAGLAEGIAPEAQAARLLAASGCRVLVPALTSRRLAQRHPPGGSGGATLTDREFIQRSAFELGRTLIGYEVQKVLAGIDCLQRDQPAAGSAEPRKVGVLGWGEGGLLALYAGALDPRIDSVCVSGYFDSRQDLWQEPVDRNVFGLLKEFGDAELASLVAPRTLLIEASRAPQVRIAAGQGGAPGRIDTPPLDRVRSEWNRARSLVQGLTPAPRLELLVSGDGDGPAFARLTLARCLGALSPQATLFPVSSNLLACTEPAALAARADRQLHELDRHNQQLLTDSPYVRQQFLARLTKATPADYDRVAAEYREFFYDEVIGRCSEPLLPLNPRARVAYDRPKWTGYEVVLDVYPDVIAYGLLLVPKDLRADETRPVVVCQHGLEGRPKDVVEGDSQYYHDFAARLADLGYLTFAPQNLYLFGDRFRTLQRKANPLGLTLYSVMTAQHRQILNWLKTLPNVDPQRIAFYGLSYGGKTAMRVPALLTDYCLSICSGDFNEWVWKNASTRSPYSYVWTGEYEIFEFDLGCTFNYAEMAALIAPRPFMVERGHFDNVAPDETVAYEFAKVQHLYEAKLHLPDRCAIEWFVGPHTIHGQGTFEFLGRHLHWPAK